MNLQGLKIKERIRKKTEGKETFIKVLIIAICVNLGLVAFYAAVALSYKDISLTVNGKTAEIKTIRNSVDDMLRVWSVDLGEKDQVSMDRTALLKDGDEIEIKTFKVDEKTLKEDVAFREKTEYTSDMMEGEKKVTQKGVKGTDKVTYRITYFGGEVMEKKEIARETLTKPVTRITMEGTAISYNGVKYSRKLTVSSTAYCLRGRTATGTSVHMGTIAVDPRVIPLGSYGYVPGYGQVHAEDTGGAIKGNIIDVWFPTYSQCRNWGRRTVDIYIK
ncbi:MAG: 3D domain-containing protein [Eubacteriales bacterium]|nr:3D domain-containing protein [Eubacteriales bacterium]